MWGMFEDALAFVLTREGGYANDPDDRGGPTNYGITQRAFDTWRAGHGLVPLDVREVDRPMVRWFYRDLWKASQAALLPWPAALAYYDGIVNHGMAAGTAVLQRALNDVTPGAPALVRDGDFGPKTRERLTYAATHPGLPWRVVRQRRRLYRIIAQRTASQLKFLPGWLVRLDHLETVLEET